MRRFPLAKRAACEAVATALLLVAIVGSGIMAERLDGGNLGIALLANSIATGGALASLIAAFGPISGGHFNPVISLAAAFNGRLTLRETAAYLTAQITGAIAGVGVANAMFGQPLFFISHRARHGAGQLLAEFVATFGLAAIISGCERFRSSGLPYAAAAYIIAAYWFTSSTSFANPAVTVARSLTGTFTGIAPADVSGFILSQLAGAGGAMALFRWLRARPAAPQRSTSLPYDAIETKV